MKCFRQLSFVVGVRLGVAACLFGAGLGAGLSTGCTPEVLGVDFMIPADAAPVPDLVPPPTPPDMAPSCAAAGDYCCGDPTATQTCLGDHLVCGDDGDKAKKCYVCGHETYGRGECLTNLRLCGERCCDGNKCDTGECMSGRGMTECIDGKSRNCGHAGQPCCFVETFCVVGLTCKVTNKNGQLLSTCQ